MLSFIVAYSRCIVWHSKKMRTERVSGLPQQFVPFYCYSKENVTCSSDIYLVRPFTQTDSLMSFMVFPSSASAGSMLVPPPSAGEWPRAPGYGCRSVGKWETRVDVAGFHYEVKESRHLQASRSPNTFKLTTIHNMFVRHLKKKS